MIEWSLKKFVVSYPFHRHSSFLKISSLLPFNGGNHSFLVKLTPFLCSLTPRKGLRKANTDWKLCGYLRQHIVTGNKVYILVLVDLNQSWAIFGQKNAYFESNNPHFVPQSPWTEINGFFLQLFYVGDLFWNEKAPFMLSRGMISIKNLSFGLFSPNKVQKGPGTGHVHIFSKRNASIWYSHMFILTIEPIWQHFTALGLLKVMFS